MSVEKLQELVGYQRDIRTAWKSVKTVPARVEGYLGLIESTVNGGTEEGALYLDECKAAYHLVIGHCNEIKAWHEKGDEIIADLSRTYAAERLYKLSDKEEKKTKELYDRYRQFADRVETLVKTIKEFEDRFKSEVKEL